jgi:uncharacterized damage-inducible protein DinB
MTASTAPESATMMLAIEELNRLLDDLASVLFSIGRDAYVAKPACGLSGSIGGHVRHVLDHVGAFVDAGPRVLTYDRRRRGTAVEADPADALAHICRLQTSMESMAARRHDEPIQVLSQIAPDGRAILSPSSLGRELAFVMSHTVHHQAIIALLLADAGEAILPERFGYAPSTPMAS